MAFDEIPNERRTQLRLAIILHLLGKEVDKLETLVGLLQLVVETSDLGRDVPVVGSLDDGAREVHSFIHHSVEINEV